MFKFRFAGCGLRVVVSAVSMAAASFFALHANAADNYPSRPVTLVVPTPPAGPLDFFARALSPLLNKRWSGSVVVDNKPGAGTALGTQAVVRANADGHTLLVANIAVSAHGALSKAPLFDVERDLQPLTVVASAPYFFIASQKSPDTLEKFVAHGKAHPDKLNLAIIPNSQQHLDTARIMATLGIRAVLVPYSGTAPITRALLAGEVDGYLGTLAGMQPFFEQGRLHPLAVTSAQRWATLPKVPTLISKGYALELNPWYALFAPAQTPAPVLAQLRKDLVEVMQDPAFQAKVVEGGYVPRTSTASELAQMVSSNLRMSRELARTYNIQPD